MPGQMPQELRISRDQRVSFVRGASDVLSAKKLIVEESISNRESSAEESTAREPL